MNIIRTQLHALADYLVGFILLMPWIMDYTMNAPDTWAFCTAGFFILTYSILTDYEGGLIKIIPMKFHLFLDFLTYIFVILVPVMFPVQNYYLSWPFVLGFGGFVLTILSSSKPYLHKMKDKDITKPFF